MKARNALRSFGFGKSMTAETFFGSAEIPSADTTYPRKFTSLCTSSHLLGFSLSPALARREKTTLRLARCSSNVLPITNMSSR